MPQVLTRGSDHNYRQERSSAQSIVGDHIKSIGFSGFKKVGLQMKTAYYMNPTVLKYFRCKSESFYTPKYERWQSELCLSTPGGGQAGLGL